MISNITTKLFLLIAALSITLFVSAQVGYTVGYSAQLHNGGHSIFVKESDTSRFVTSLVESLTSGSIKAYDIQNKGEKLLTPAQVLSRLYLIDTVITVDPATKKENRKIFKQLVNISGISFEEEWIMDKNAHLTKRVKSYTLSVKNFDPNGNAFGDAPLMKIKND